MLGVRPKPRWGRRSCCLRLPIYGVRHVWEGKEDRRFMGACDACQSRFPDQQYSNNIITIIIITITRYQSED
jgi:hypothetical protein